MREPIEVNYEPDGDDWRVTATGRGRTLTGKATGLIAARDRADQLVAKIVPEEERRTVVHLLNGDALAFTSAYLSARLAKPTETPVDEKPAGETADEKQPEAKDEEPSAEQPDPAPQDDGTPDDGPDADSQDIGHPEVPSPTPSSDQAQKASTS